MIPTVRTLPGTLKTEVTGTENDTIGEINARHAED